ncbi:E3 SUMO-protein ligase KIAA1586-like [Haematobia irritans]|uniref:E3 SUMO-protein ligase KIAA1586-like n=1 Tax=Haematobia irritans TaxID=7368 RepID=UPI003F50B97B
MYPKIIYKQKIRDSWMQQKEFKDWVAKDASDETKAFCTYCKCSINAKVFDLRAHAKTKKHISRANCFVQSNKLNFVPTLTKSAEQEAALCLFVAEHTSIGTIDHLTKLCIQNFYKSNSAEVIKMQRTKCANIIRNVLSPHFKEDLRNDIGKSKFSILLDESTDISVTKLLGIVINYFSMERGKITSTFLGLVQLDSGDAVGIVNALLEVLNNWKLDPKHLIGIGTDNASVMTGRNRGVYAELKKRIPSLILIRCVCHSVQLAVNYSCGKFLPDTLEFLIYETYNWFSKSSNRQLAYKNIYQLINNDKVHNYNHK